MQHRNALSQLFVAFSCLAGAAQASELQMAMYNQEKHSPAAEVVKHEAPVLSVREIPSLPSLAEPVDLTTPSEDLWQRLRNGFSMPGLNNELVLQHQLWYQNHPDYLRRVVDRSRRYLHHIVEALEKRGMPTELALLPLVESSFNPMAYS